MRRSGCAAVLLLLVSAPVAAQSRWVAPRTPWGDPDLQGVYTNIEEQRVPIERPERFAGRTLESITASELAEFARQRNAAAAGRPDAHAFGGLSPMRFDLRPSRPWLVVDPADGRIPALTPLGQQRRQQYAARLDAPPASAGDSNLWYRCISIGLPRSMMPTGDGDTYRIVQAPGHVAIQYEIMHEARVIPLDRRPHVGSAIAAYMGDARGRWDGDTLVVETRNFKGEFQTTNAAGKDLRIVERFTPTRAGAIEWSVTIDDASGWTRPWTLAMPLTRVDDIRGPLENACHEGNYVLRNILSAARAEELARVPRTPDGHPDLEGVWNFATLTPLQRPERFAGRPYLSDLEAAVFERELLEATLRRLRAGAFVDELWFEPGRLARINGQYPTSLIVEPADGQLPALTPAGSARAATAAARTALGRRFDTLSDFGVSERCLRSAAGPPYMGAAPDAELLRIVQSRDHVALVQEKFHETRLVPLTRGASSPAPAIRSWLGFSRGRWDGDTLEVETTNFTPQLALANRFDEQLRLVERFTRVGPDTLLYEFTVHDPTFFTAPWTVRLPMTRTDNEVYEFACHEGNYSLPNMLRAARAEETSVEPAISTAWMTAGARSGWLAPDRNENWVYRDARPEAAGALPAFRFAALAAGGLVNLPEPNVPFALVFDGAPISDEALDGLARFANLKALYLSRTPVTDGALTADRLPAGLRVLYLGATKVTDAGVKELARLEQLEWLRLSGTAVTDAGLWDVARLRRLQWLNLESTGVSDEGVTQLRGLTALRILHVGNTQVTDTGLERLATLPALQIVRVIGSRITAGGAAATRKRRPSLTVLP